MQDLLARETFYKEFPAIDQRARNIGEEFQRRFASAVEARAAAYEQAITKLHNTPGWEALNEDQQQRVARPLASRAGRQVSPHTRISELRADREACASRLNKAIAEMLQMVDGNRVVTLSASGFFSGGIEDEEQLDAALTGLREECVRLIATGKKVLVQ